MYAPPPPPPSEYPHQFPSQPSLTHWENSITWWCVLSIKTFWTKNPNSINFRKLIFIITARISDSFYISLIETDSKCFCPSKLLELKRGDAVPDQLKNDMSEYLTEANLPPPTAENVCLVSDALILYNVIEKRRGELDDLAKGMESIGLINYLSKHRQIGSLLFPRTARIKASKNQGRRRIKHLRATSKEFLTSIHRWTRKKRSQTLVWCCI